MIGKKKDPIASVQMPEPTAQIPPVENVQQPQVVYVQVPVEKKKGGCLKSQFHNR